VSDPPEKREKESGNNGETPAAVVGLCGAAIDR